MLIRLQADLKAIGHYLPRPAAAISAKAWTKVFNDGMDQRCVRFEIPSSELENWRSTNSFLRPSKEAVERIFDEWIEVEVERWLFLAEKIFKIFFLRSLKN